MSGRFGKGHIADPIGRIASGAHVLLGAVRDSISPKAGGLNFGSAGIEYEPVLDQESTSECVGFALSCSITETFKAQGRPLPERVAPHSIYIPARCLDREDYNQPLIDDGSMPSQAFRSIGEFGVTGESKWPFNPATVNDEPRLDKIERMSQCKLAGHYKVYDRGDALVERVRQALAARLAVFFAINVTRAFEDYTSGVMNAGDHLLSGEVLGGHALHALDYDTSESGLTVVRFKNSWSTGWGEDGYGRCDDSFIRRWSDVYIVDVHAKG